jgi:5-methylcytosine-specific restriction endonuclease McrA
MSCGRRRALSKTDRQDALRKTGRRCLICGGRIKRDDWQVDHVLAHSTGGGQATENFLPAHTIYNDYRWHYGSEEF